MEEVTSAQRSGERHGRTQRDITVEEELGGDTPQVDK